MSPLELNRLPLKFGKTKFTAPVNWGGVTITEFVKMTEWAKNDPENIYKLWAIFSGIPEETLLKVPADSILRCDRYIQFLEKPVQTSSLKTPETLELDGGLIVKIPENLRLTTYGQYIVAEDLVNSMRDGKGQISPESIARNSVKMCSILLFNQLSTDDFSKKGAESVEHYFENCRFVDIYPIVLFFCNSYLDLHKNVRKGSLKKRILTLFGLSTRN